MASDDEGLRSWLASLVEIPEGGVAADLGCGDGRDLVRLSRAHPQASRFLGLDADVGRVPAPADARLEFRQADLDQGVPLPDASCDAVLSHNLLECLADKAGFLEEVARVLRPGGQIVCSHMDWDTQAFDGGDKARVRRVLSAFNDWKQPWMKASDAWMGRRLWRTFGESGRFAGRIESFTLTGTRFEEGSYPRTMADAIAAMGRRGIVSEDVAAFLEEQRELADRGVFFYAVTAFAFVGKRL